MNFDLVEFTNETLDIANKQWLDEATQLDYPVQLVNKTFSNAVNNIDYANAKNNSLNYGIYCEKTGVCLAVVDVIVSKNNPQKKLIKMLTVDLCPYLVNDIISEKMEQVANIVNVYSIATLGTIALTDTHNIETVKLYGRDHAMKLLLNSLKSSINENPQINAVAVWEGLWLKVTPDKK